MLRGERAVNQEYKRWLDNASDEIRDELKDLTPEEVRERFSLISNLEQVECVV